MGGRTREIKVMTNPVEMPKDGIQAPPAVIVQFQKIDDRAVIPRYAHDGDMCMDLSVIIDKKDMRPFIMSDGVITPETQAILANAVMVQTLGNKDYVSLEPGHSLVFHTGLRCSTPKGFGMNVFVRSSTGIKSKLRLCNGTGKIDTSQYRGELLIGLHNYGNSAKKIFSGDRVAQAEIIRVLNVAVVEVSELSKTERGEGGFGSTGR